MHTQRLPKTVHKFEMWACKLSLEAHEVVIVHVEACNLATGEREKHDNVCTRIIRASSEPQHGLFRVQDPSGLKLGKDNVLVLANDHELKSEEQQTVVAVVSLQQPDCDSGKCPYRRPSIGQARTSSRHKWLDVSSEVPFKSLMLDVVERKLDDDHDVAFESVGTIYY